MVSTRNRVNECKGDITPTIRPRVLSVTKRSPAERSLEGAKPSNGGQSQTRRCLVYRKLLEVTGAAESENVHRESSGQTHRTGSIA